MCVVSMIMEHYTEKWDAPRRYGDPIDYSLPHFNPPAISPKEVAEFKRLLERAREYDKKHNEPDCELEEKRQALKRVADKLGLDIAFIDKT